MAESVTTSSHRISATGTSAPAVKASSRESTGRTGAISRTGAHEAPKGFNTARTGSFTATRISTGITAALGMAPSGLHEAVKPEKPAKPKMPAAKKRKIYIVAIILAVIMIIAAAFTLNSTTSTSKYNNYLESAQALYDSGDYDAALMNLRKASAIRESDETYIIMAQCYANMQNYDKALEILRGLNTSDAKVETMISDIQSGRDAMLVADMITVCGMQYAPETSVLKLEDGLLGNALVNDLAQLYGLTDLSIAGNAVTDISALSVLGGLVSLDISNNSVSDISALSQLSSLRSLVLDNNPVKDLTPLYNLTELTMLSIKGLNLTETQLSELSAALPKCAIHSDAVDNENSGITIGGITFNPDVTAIDLSGLGISDISALSACTGLTEIILDDNDISDISPLMDIPGLEKLSVRGNAITDLRPLISLSGLSYVDASDNEISSTVAIGSLPAIKTLYLDGNPISDFSGLAKMTSVEILSLKNTGISDDILPELYNLTGLKSLYLDDNDEISGEGFDRLSKEIRGCIISHSELVYSVNFGGEYFKENITELTLVGKGIVDISSLSSFENLTSICLSGNNIFNIYILEYIKSPVTYLDLSSNCIEDATPVSSLYSLTYLDMSYNSISSVNSFMHLSHLEYLNLTGNKLSADQIQTLQNALPNCEIVF